MGLSYFRLILWLGFCAVIACLAVEVRGDLLSGESIEWMVADSDVIVRGRLVQVAMERPADTSIGREAPPPRIIATMEVTEAIKGAGGQRVRIRCRSENWLDSLKEAPKLGTEQVWFLLSRNRGGTVAKEDDGDYPLALRPDNGLIALDGKRLGAYQMDFHWVRGRDEFLNALRAAAKFVDAAGHHAAASSVPSTRSQEATSPRAESIYVSIPSVPDFDGHDGPDVGESVAAIWRRLRVPVDERLERLARKWIGHRSSRLIGVASLARFPTQQNAALLASALKADESSAQWTGSGKARTVYFELRQRVSATLAAANVALPDIALEMPRDLYRPLWPRVACVSIAIVLWRAAASRRLRCGQWRSRLWPPAVVWFCAGSLASCAMSMRSWHTVDEVTWSTRAGRWWVSSVSGGMQVAYIRNWPQWAWASLLTTPYEPPFRDLWADVLDVKRTSAEFAGFKWNTGTNRAWDGRTYPYSTCRIPWWAIAALLSAAPVKKLASFMWHAEQRYRWEKQGRCTACGYDLRGSNGKCPECGEGHGDAVMRRPGPIGRKLRSSEP